ncbi:MAG: hypothetical protein JO187_00190 [Acidobacteria bacterium]|nr:hypothetical protein [Acidobacteriota bacterium]
MTVDEELELLEDNLRRLKIEYEKYFNGGSKRPPNDLDWKVRGFIKKHSDSRRLSNSQRFRYNTIVQRFAVYNDLWRQKLKIREEGYRRPQDALLSIAGLRTEEEHQAEETLNPKHVQHAKTFSVTCAEIDKDQHGVRALFDAFMDARHRSGTPGSGSFESFQEFVRNKTEQIRREHRCSEVEYTVETRDGQVRLKAKAK